MFVCSFIFFVVFVIVGGLGIMREDGIFKKGISVVIVVFFYVVIVVFNFLMGFFVYSIVFECVVGWNCNKIMFCVIGFFFFIVWVIVFISLYFYYDVNFGFMVGFIYVGFVCIMLLYCWFCVGDIIG